MDQNKTTEIKSYIKNSVIMKQTSLISTSILTAVILFVTICDIFKSHEEIRDDVYYNVIIEDYIDQEETDDYYHSESETKVTKLIQRGNHTFIPDPETVLGPNGEKGYVHDPKFLIKNPPSFNIPKDQILNVCKSPHEPEDAITKGLKSLKKIRHHIETSESSRDVKLFCSIYTFSPNVHMTDAISQTWGRRCDGMLFASNITDLKSGHLNLPSSGIWKCEYHGIFQRVRVMMAYLYDNFLDDYDYFHFSGDDLYMMVENMKEFLASDKVKEWDEVPDQYMIAGFWINWRAVDEKGDFYLGGGSGYTLSKKALKAYVEGPLQYCNTNKETPMEDIEFSQCVKKYLTTKFIDTRDEVGAHRYHQYNVGMHSAWPRNRESNKIFGHKMNRVIHNSLRHMEEEFGFPFVTQDAYVSNSSVVFHNHDASYLRRMEVLLYGNIDDVCSSLEKI